MHFIHDEPTKRPSWATTLRTHLRQL